MSDTTLGAPLDLLAHWTYRHQSLWRDLNEARAVAKKWHRQNKALLGVTTGGDEELDDEVHHLKYLVAEAEWWTIRLAIEANYLFQLKPPPAEPRGHLHISGNCPHCGEQLSACVEVPS